MAVLNSDGHCLYLRESHGWGWGFWRAAVCKKPQPHRRLPGPAIPETGEYPGSGQLFSGTAQQHRKSLCCRDQCFGADKPGRGDGQVRAGSALWPGGELGCPA